MEQLDFHTHTTCSDGLLSPEQLIDRAAQLGVQAISITDHDTLEAYSDKTFATAANVGINLIPGVEISTIDSDGIKAHILALGVDPANESLLLHLANQNLARSQYTGAIVEKLVEGGWQVDSKALLQAETTVTKAHIARSVIADGHNYKKLTRYFGEIPTVGSFIEAFMLKGQEYYVKSDGMLTPEQAVEVTHYAGGLACYAHPVATLFEAEIDMPELERKIVSSNVDAIETEYMYYSKRLQDKQIDMRLEFRGLADKLHLLSAGGSDFHGASALYGNYVELGFNNLPSNWQQEAAKFMEPLATQLLSR